jgi:tRNA (mo5U34)-methyltransferase
MSTRARGARVANGHGLRADVESTHWYHTIELAPGLVTPGWFDLRPVVDRMPWPDVAGRRCLDVGTYDGFLAFELERRGATEVVCTDITDHNAWDWPAALRAQGPERLAAVAGPEKGRGFEVARRALGSRVEKVEVSVYDLSPEDLGTFDVVVCGSLMLHLREPLRALEAIRSVCGGHFLSAETISLDLGARLSSRPSARLDGVSELCQWWVPNAAGHRRMVEAAGFAIERSPRPYTIPFGPGHPPRSGLRSRAVGLGRRILARGDGVPHAAVLARPAVWAVKS